MRKIFYLLIAFLFTNLCANAQPQIETSEKFEEPVSEGWTKLLLLKNGNTFYIHYGGKKGLEVTVFGKNKKLVGSHNIVSQKWNAKKSKFVFINGLYEINNEPVLFLQYNGDKSPTLYRIRLNANNGALVKEEVLGKLPKGFMAKRLNSHGGVQSIIVEKDPESDCYAAIFINYLTDKADERIKVLHYDGSHKLLNSTFFTSPNPDYDDIEFVGAIVDSNRRIFMSTYVFKDDNKKGQIYISRLNANEKTFLNRSLDFSDDFGKTRAVMIYNQNNNTIVMLTNSFASRKDEQVSYASFISFINPESLALKGVRPVSSEKINQFAHDNLGLDIEYSGLPQQMLLNEDNTITLLQETGTKVITYSQKTGAVMGIYFLLGNIGITELSSENKEQKGYLMMKDQYYAGDLQPMEMANWKKGVFTNQHFSKSAINDNQFMSYDYIHTKNNHYVIFNDNPKNDKKTEDNEKRKLTSNTDRINTICYTIHDGVATKSYLFGEPNGKNNTKACYIACSDWDKRTNTYTTVVSEQHGRKYDSKIAWIHFDK